MQNENQNNWQTISDRLDGMESLPGEAPLERERVWSGIHGRLHTVRKRVAFWSAAAALLICFSTAGVLRYSFPRSGANTSDRSKGWSAKKKYPVPAAPASGAIGTATDSSADIAKTVHGTTRVTSAPPAMVPHPAATKRSLPATPGRRLVLSEETAVQKNSLSDKNELGVNTAVALPDSVQAMSPATLFADARVKSDSSLPVATARKPLRVVHLNDLEEPGFPETGRDNAVKGNWFSPASRFPIGYFSGPSSTSSNAGPAAPRNSFFRINLDR